tara:strand:- start:267 stop:638 length:372 start_codon:yes stop_codon:yes gene_type:complete
MLISQAYAQEAVAAVPMLDPPVIIMMVAMFGVFWFLVIRPQSKRAKEHKAMLNAIKRGDQVVTNGGIIGRVARIEGDDVLIIEIAEGVRIKQRQSMIASMVQKPEPRAVEADNDDDKSVKKDD